PGVSRAAPRTAVGRGRHAALGIVGARPNLPAGGGWIPGAGRRRGRDMAERRWGRPAQRRCRPPGGMARWTCQVEGADGEAAGP
ncbi:MAG: hypothetical protein ABIZ09_18675, partial [Rhodoferax sp.]